MNNFILAYIKGFARTALLSLAVLAVFAASIAGAQSRPLRIVLAPRSTADPVEVMKHFSKNCANVAITTSERNSDYMLYAGGWSGNYRFMLIRKGGDVLFTTETALLSNSVKNVCKYLNSHQASADANGRGFMVPAVRPSLAASRYAFSLAADQ